MSILTKIQVPIGIKTWVFPIFIDRSKGNLPRGSLLTRGQNKPITTIIAPSIRSSFCIYFLTFYLVSYAYSLFEEKYFLTSSSVYLLSLSSLKGSKSFLFHRSWPLNWFNIARSKALASPLIKPSSILSIRIGHFVKKCSLIFTLWEAPEFMCLSRFSLPSPDRTVVRLTNRSSVGLTFTGSPIRSSTNSGIIRHVIAGLFYTRTAALGCFGRRCLTPSTGLPALNP